MILLLSLFLLKQSVGITFQGLSLVPTVAAIFNPPYILTPPFNRLLSRHMFFAVVKFDARNIDGTINRLSYAKHLHVESFDTKLGHTKTKNVPASRLISKYPELHGTAIQFRVKLVKMCMFK